MKRPVEKKCYYRIEFVLDSPLMVGSGKNEQTDKDIVKDNRGIPYIPGTAVAGAALDLFDAEKEKALREKYFGYVLDSKGAKKAAESGGQTAASSRIVFYDACLCPEDLQRFRITRRDCVALDEWKTAKPGAKFDMEVLEPGVRFVTYMEQNLYAGDEAAAERIAAAWLTAGMDFGGKTMRGYGKIADVSIKKKEFVLKDPSDAEKWLDFDMYTEQNWDTYQVSEAAKADLPQRSCRLTLSLKLQGAISIRKYTTKVRDKSAQMAEPDFEQLTVRRDQKDVPVIPGTTWSGAFRSQMRRLIPNLDEAYFGNVKAGSPEQQAEKRRSKIGFSECELNGAEEKILSRNAIDRFGGGTVDGALFTERTCYGGTTKLVITFGRDVPDQLLDALAACILDLHYGFLAVGGMTGVGRGLFEVTAVNDKPFAAAADSYQLIRKEMADLKRKAEL